MQFFLGFLELDKDWVGNISFKFIFDLSHIIDLSHHLWLVSLIWSYSHELIQTFQFTDGVFECEHIFCFLFDAIHFFLTQHTSTMKSSPMLFWSYFIFSLLNWWSFWLFMSPFSARLSLSSRPERWLFSWPSDPSISCSFKRHCLRMLKLWWRYWVERRLLLSWERRKAHLWRGWSWAFPRWIGWWLTLILLIIPFSSIR